MTREQTIRQWKRSILNTHITLNNFYATLTEWQANNHHVHPDTFNDQLDALDRSHLLYDWADRNPAGGGLDALFEAVTGQTALDDYLPLKLTDDERVQQLIRGVTRQ